MFRPSILGGLAAVICTAQAGAVSFSAASATFEQSFDNAWTAAKAIDGILPSAGAAGTGWAVYDNTRGTTASQSALFTLAAPLAAGRYILTYTLSQTYGGAHTLDTFSLGYTTASVPTLTSAQTMVDITAATSRSGATLQMPAVGHIDAAGSLPSVDVYTVVAGIHATASVTGLFLNAIDIAGAGPGRAPNGNFVLTEFAVAAAVVPEPSHAALLAAGLASLGLLARRRRLARAHRAD